MSDKKDQKTKTKVRRYKSGIEQPSPPGWTAGDEAAFVRQGAFQDLIQRGKLDNDDWFRKRFAFFYDDESRHRILKKMDQNSAKYKELHTQYLTAVNCVTEELDFIPTALLQLVFSYHLMPFDPLMLDRMVDIVASTLPPEVARNDFSDTKVVKTKVPQGQQNSTWNLHFDPNMRYLGCLIEDARIVSGNIQYKAVIPRLVPEQFLHYDGNKNPSVGSVWVSQERLAGTFHIFPKVFLSCITTMNWRSIMPKFYGNPRDTSCFLGDGEVQVWNGDCKRVRDLRVGDVLSTGARVSRVDYQHLDPPRQMSVVKINGFHVTSGHPILVQVPKEVDLEQPPLSSSSISSTSSKEWVHPWEVITPFHSSVEELYHFELAYDNEEPVKGHQRHTITVNDTVCATLGCDTGRRLRALHPQDDERYGVGYWKN